MVMTDIIIYCVAALWGLILGLFYFGGLYHTIKLAAGKRTIKSIFFLSFLIRTILVLAGFWLILRYGLRPFVISFILFVVTRFIMTKKLGPKSERG